MSLPDTNPGLVAADPTPLALVSGRPLSHLTCEGRRMSLPRLHLISLGGTIASTGAETSSGVGPKLGAADLVAAVPGLDGLAEITTEQLAQVGSSSLTPDLVVAVARAARAAVDDGARGIVVTQGTDTLEETAYLLSLLGDDRAPIAVTGAMRNPTLAGPDGPANLLAAAQVALSDELRGVRSVAVFSDEIHDPQWVRKDHTTSTAAFTSGPHAGPIGWVHEGSVRLHGRPVAAPSVALPSTSIPPVALVPAGLGEDLRLVDALADLGYAGAVIDGVGGGHVHADAVPRLEALAARMPVVLASRTGSGLMLASTYGYPGSELDLLGRGLRSAGPLPGRKARLLLGVLLANDAVEDWPY